MYIQRLYAKASLSSILLSRSVGLLYKLISSHLISSHLISMESGTESLLLDLLNASLSPGPFRAEAKFLIRWFGTADTFFDGPNGGIDDLTKANLISEYRRLADYYWWQDDHPGWDIWQEHPGRFSRQPHPNVFQCMPRSQSHIGNMPQLLHGQL